MRTRSLGAVALLPTVALAVVALFGFQAIRVFAPSIGVGLVELRGVSPTVATSIIVAVAGFSFVAVGLVPATSRPAVLGAVALAASLRVLLQLITAPLASLAISALIVAITGVVIGMMAAAFGGRVAGAGLLLGAGLDVAFMGARRTLDVTRSTGLAALLLVAGLAVAAVGSVWVEQQLTGPRRYGLPVPAAALFMIGPWFGIHVLITGNLGLIRAASGAAPAAAAGVAALGVIGALGWTAPGRGASQPALAAVAATVGLGLLARADGGWAAFLFVVIATTLGASLTGALERESTAPPSRMGWAVGAGVVTAALLVAAAVASVELPFGFSGDAVYPVLGLAVLGGAVAANAHRSASAPPWIVPAIAATALLIVPFLLWASEPSRGADEAVPAPVVDDSPNEVLVVTYDLNHGFDPTGRLDLEPMVRTLADSAWEIGSLQEVGRGALRFGGVDMVTWLEHRLATEVAWVPNGSRLSGISLISRFGLTDVAALPLEPEGRYPVSAIDAHVALPDSGLTLRVLGVSVPDERAADAAAMLIEGWHAEGASVVLGNLGGGPDSGPVQAVLTAGFYDVGRLVDGSPATYPSDVPTEQRDLILISQDLSLSAVRVLDSTASDHRPVVVRVLVIPPEE